jgi:regulator of sigma E protease
MALISIGLGILNLLPVPVLDGGHLLFFAIEGLRGRPLSPRARNVATSVGVALVLSLLVFAFRNDIARYWTG